MSAPAALSTDFRKIDVIAARPEGYPGGHVGNSNDIQTWMLLKYIFSYKRNIAFRKYNACFVPGQSSRDHGLFLCLKVSLAHFKAVCDCEFEIMRYRKTGLQLTQPR